MRFRASCSVPANCSAISTCYERLRYRERAVATTASSRRPVWITLAIALLIHVALLSFQINHRINTDFIRSAILDSLTPVEKLVDRISSSVYGVWDGYFALV